MKRFIGNSIVILLFSISQLFGLVAKGQQAATQKLFIDVHHLTPGSVSFEDVAAAHAKDIATQDKYGVKFLKYWVDEKNGNIYCLSSAADSNHIVQTHRAAHGLLPHEIHAVEEGVEAKAKSGKQYFLDIHELGKVSAADVAKAHEKDLAVQRKYGVNFINYWVDEKKGVVYCLSQSANATKVVETHKHAHGFMPVSIVQVKEGQ
jgi:uncharacterized protein Usg